MGEELISPVQRGRLEVAARSAVMNETAIHPQPGSAQLRDGLAGLLAAACSQAGPAAWATASRRSDASPIVTLVGCDGDLDRRLPACVRGLLKALSKT